MVQVGIIGASGFTGAELLRLIAQHPEFELVVATGDSQAGVRAAELYPSLAVAYPDLVFDHLDLGRIRQLDAVFLGLPHAASMDLAQELVGEVPLVVDLSAAFRLKDATAYPQYYGFEHDQLDLLAEAVYGLPELYRDDLVGARLVATPGCHVTAATLAVRPFIEAGLIEPTGIVINSSSGISGAGRKSDYTYSFTTIDENVTAYELLTHRHTPEIEQELGAEVLFTPHLVPMNRGILSTCSARVAADSSPDAVLEMLHERWADEPFIAVVDSPSTKACLGSNMVQVTARYDARTGMMLMIAAIDNLAKGASGGAIQAANVALGIEETAGLTTVGVAP